MPPAGAWSGNYRWSRNDERLLRRDYQRYGPRYVARLLGRTRAAVRNKAYQMKLTETPGRSWTAVDDRTLRRYHAHMAMPELAAKLGRSVPAVGARLTKLGLSTEKAPAWSAKEIAFLRRHAHTMRRSEVAARLGRPLGGVNRMVAHLGLSHERTVFPKTPGNLAFIRKNAGTLSFVQIARHLGTNAETIRKIALGFGFRARPTSRPWTPSDDALLGRLYGTMPRKQVAARMNRTWEAVAVRAKDLGLTKPIARAPVVRPWTAREERRLRAMAGTYTKPEIARRLDRTVAAVAGRMAALGLMVPRTSEHRAWTAKEDAYLRRNVARMSRAAMAERLGRTHVAITGRLRHLGLGNEKHYAIEPRAWSPEDDRRLRHLSRSIRSLEELGRLLSRTRNAVGARKKKLGLSVPRTK